jgi:aminomethyltransferase
MVDFAGWDMPVQYSSGIIEEHLATRRGAGLFDVSHMGRFVFQGEGALPFLQHVLTNNAAALGVGDIGAQYTMIPTPSGGAVDDAYLYRFTRKEYLLVVNAANRKKDWEYFQSCLGCFPGVKMYDRTDELAMLALQGPRSRELLEGMADGGRFPEPARNAVGTVAVGEAEVLVARTGYTGEPLCFELFFQRKWGSAIWDRIIDRGATPAGLGARDTLRLEAGLPLYGHELGLDPEGREIPVMACPDSSTPFRASSPATIP